jgi:hypothetical protein
VGLLSVRTGAMSPKVRLRDSTPTQVSWLLGPALHKKFLHHQVRVSGLLKIAQRFIAG